MLATQETDIFYPESDGKPMAETDVHRILLTRMVELLGQAFPEAYVSGNICLYYVPGNAQKMISPDALLSREQPPGKKRVYKTWEDDQQLDLVMEFSSKSTKRIDYQKKKNIYEQILEVPYYLIYDPHSMVLDLFALEGGKYQAVSSNEKGYWELPDLGIQVGLELPHSLCLFDAQGNRILDKAEQERQAKEAAQEAKKAAEQETEQERQAKEAAQQETEQERQAKEAAQQAKKAAQEETEQERQAKEAAQQELEALKAQLKALQNQSS